MDSIDELFKKTNASAYRKFKDQDFDNVHKVHDWKNYVPEELSEHWYELTERERKLIFILTEPMADREEWD